MPVTPLPSARLPSVSPSPPVVMRDPVLELLRECQWPELPARYDQALRQAVRFILARFAVHGIILSGTILERMPDATSDLDICVIHAHPQRQRLQRWFNGVPAEIFVNPEAAIRDYFVAERRRPATANMLAKGHVVLRRDPVVDELRSEAEEWLLRLPDLSPLQLRQLRYFAADRLDNAKDLQRRDPATAQMILQGAVRQIVDYCFLAANRHLPREKRSLESLDAIDPVSARLAREFYAEPVPAARFEIAQTLARHAMGVTGFFEWESELELYPPPKGEPHDP